MGASSSHEIVIPMAGPSTDSADAERQRASEAYRTACVPRAALFVPSGLEAHAPTPPHARLPPTCSRSATTIFQDGYRQGASEASVRFNEGAQVAVRAAFSRALVEEEGRRAQELEEIAAALRKSQYRCVGGRGEGCAPRRLPAVSRASHKPAAPSPASLFPLPGRRKNP